MRWRNAPSFSRKSLLTWYDPLFLSSCLSLSLSPYTGFFLSQIENSFSLSVPIFKQFHKNIIGKGGANIKKVRFIFFTGSVQI